MRTRQRSIEEQLVDFIGVAKDSPNISVRRWLTGIKISIYLRKEAKEGKTAITIANVEYSDRFDNAEDNELFKRYISLIHQLNPFDCTVLETVGHDLAQWLWDNDWQKLNQLGCFMKIRNHGFLGSGSKHLKRDRNEQQRMV